MCIAFSPLAPARAIEPSLPAEAPLVWDLSRIYESPEAWAAARDAVKAEFPALAAYRGRLGEGAGVLLELLEKSTAVRKEFSRLWVYAGLKSDEDTRIAANLGRRQELGLLSAELGRATSFIRPELLALGDEQLRAYLASEPGLAPYRFFLEDLMRERPHILGEEAEAVLSQTSLLAGGPSQIYNLLANADIAWPEITLPDGRKVRIDNAGYTLHRTHEDRAVRQAVFDAFWPVFKQYERTFGASLFAQVRADVFYARVRKHPSALAAVLSRDNIPEAVYRTLLAEVNASLPTLHRYLRLRGKLLGIEDLRYYDIYPPLVKLDRTYPPAVGRELVLAAAAPLGEAYQAKLAEALGGPWTHYPATPGKQSGAYMSGGAYDVHPYVLINYQDNWDSVTTLAHEWGHGMHSRLANAAQPYPTAGYSLFTAEIASTLNEILLSREALARARTDEERLFHLGSALERLRGTFYRQAMFAEFELAIHEVVERGGSLTGERLTQLYGEIVRRHHGHAEGVLHVDDQVCREWAFIPHFYRGYYVYQYATSIAAANQFADRILAGEPGAVETYLGVLEAGGSDHPYEIVRRAGVDLATPAPYQSTVARMNAIMDEIEAILARRAGPSA